MFRGCIPAIAVLAHLLRVGLFLADVVSDLLSPRAGSDTATSENRPTNHTTNQSRCKCSTIFRSALPLSQDRPGVHGLEIAAVTALEHTNKNLTAASAPQQPVTNDRVATQTLTFPSLRRLRDPATYSPRPRHTVIAPGHFSATTIQSQARRTLPGASYRDDHIGVGIVVVSQRYCYRRKYQHVDAMVVHSYRMEPHLPQAKASRLLPQRQLISCSSSQDMALRPTLMGTTKQSCF